MPLPPKRALAEAQQRLAQGDLRRAEPLFRQVLKTHPHSGGALGGLGVIAARTGHLDAALRLFTQARQADPQEPDHGVNLGSALWQLNRRTEAVEVFAATAKAAPAARRPRQALASALLETGHLKAARDEAETLLALDRGAADAHALLGRILLRGGHPKGAIDALREAVRLAPKHPAFLNDLALALSSMGHRTAAVETLRKALDLAGDGPGGLETALNLAGALIADQQAEEAEAVLRLLREAHPTHVGLSLTLGDALQRQGRFEDSRALFQAALDQEPGNIVALRGLAKSGRVSAGDPLIDRLRASIDDTATPPDMRIEALYALGKALDDAGRPGEAFQALTQANALQAQARPFNPDLLDDLVEQSRAVFSPALFQDLASFGDPSEQPVFIVGMPRSGTSLVEQIIASHPAAAGAGELGDFGEAQRHLAARLASEAPYPGCLRDMKNGAVLGEIAERYRAQLEDVARRAGKPDARRVTDKMPDNALRLGLIALTFPRAKVIVCRRDPMDTGLSIFQQNFAGGVPYASDLSAIGRVMIAHDRMMAHWRSVLPLALMEVEYETLVSDLEPQSRRLLDFLGLDWDPAVLRFHETDRPVYTASKWQVRQPIFTNSVGRWRRYEADLEPLAMILKNANLLDHPL